MGDNVRDEAPGQLGGAVVALGLGQMALEDRVGRALPELGLEHGCEREPAARAAAPDVLLVAAALRAGVVRRRRHRPGP